MSGVHIFAAVSLISACGRGLRASAHLSSFPSIVNMLLVSSKATAPFLVSVSVVVIYLCFFCCENDEEYSNSSTSPPLPTAMTWLLYQSSPPFPILEARLLPSKRSTTATALITPVSHRIMLGRQVRLLQPLTTSAQPQRPISPTVFITPVASPSFEVFSPLVRLFLAPRYATVYTALYPYVFAQTHALGLFQI